MIVASCWMFSRRCDRSFRSPINPCRFDGVYWRLNEFFWPTMEVLHSFPLLNQETINVSHNSSPSGCPSSNRDVPQHHLRLGFGWIFSETKAAWRTRSRLAGVGRGGLDLGAGISGAIVGFISKSGLLTWPRIFVRDTDSGIIDHSCRFQLTDSRTGRWC